MGMMRWVAGFLLVVLGTAAFGAYCAYQASHPASWTAQNQNAVLCFVQSTFWIPAGKPVALLVLAGAGGAALLAGAFLLRCVTALAFAVGAGCFGVLGAAGLAERARGAEPVLDAARGLASLVDTYPRDAGILAGLGAVCLLIAAFAAAWNRTAPGKSAKKGKSRSKTAASADD